MTQTSLGGVTVHHRVHVAGGDAEKEARASQLSEWVGRVPVWLRENADPKPPGAQSRPMSAAPKLGWSI